jgi:DNA-binding Lrp family transcriptional regulator
MKAYVLINVRGGEIREVVRQLQKVENVIEATMTFGPYDAVAVLQVDDINHLGRIISRSIRPIPGVVDTLTCVATEA